MTISQKFGIWIMSALLAGAGLMIYLFYLVEIRAEATKLELFGKQSGLIIEESLMACMQKRDAAGLNRKLEEVKKASETVSRILLLNREGVVRAGTEPQLIGKKFSLGDPGCRECHQKGRRGIIMNGNAAYRWAAPVQNRPACHGCHSPLQTNNGLLIIDFSVAEFLEHVRKELVTGTAVIIVALFMIGVMMIALSNRLITRRLNRIAARMRDFQEGDFSVRAPVEGSDEITKLEKGFNELARTMAQSESNLRAIVDTEPECLKLVAADGTLLEMNPAGLAMIEADSFEEIAGQQLDSLIVPEYRPAFQVLSDRAFRGESGALEFEIVGLKGTRKWVETHSAPLRNAQGKIFALLAVTRDISNRKRAEQLIQRNYDTQTAINWILHISLENIPLDSILKQVLDLVLSIPWLSVQSKGAIFLAEGDPKRLVMKAERGLSLSIRGECAVVPFGKCLCGRAAERGDVQFSDSLDERHEVHYEGIRSHGHYCIPIKLGQNVLGIINMYLKGGHHRDDREIEFLKAIANALAGIIQRKRTEEEREKLFKVVFRSQKEWKETFDSITDMIWIVDKDHNILKANKAFSAYYQCEPREVINRKCYQIVHGMDMPIPGCPRRRMMDEKKLSEEEVLDKKTKRILRIFSFPYNSPEGDAIGSIHIARDITEDKEKEMRLMLSERLAGLGQVASGIAHEINNPLASIAGCSEGLLSRIRKRQFEPKLFESYLGIIQEEVFRCKSITSAMLSFVRKTTYEKKKIALNEMLDKTLEIIGFQGRLKNVEIIKHYHEQSPVVHGNEGELRQVFIAVITNALDAMDEKPVLTIETGVAPSIVMTETESNRFAVVRITDTGSGISPENVAKIFDPFFTTKSDRGGTGLGLAIARKIVVNHNGNIEAVSELDKGTMITITLPE